MMRRLRQSFFFARREFELKENKLFYKFSKFGNENEVAIPYEEIIGDKVSNQTSKTWLFFIGLGLIILALILLIVRYSGGDVENGAELIWMIIGVIFLIVFFFSKESFWKIKLENDQYIYFHKAIPNNIAVDEFICELIENRNKYLLSNYGQLNSKLDYQFQYNNLKWLRKINVLSEEEFDKKEVELENDF